MRKKLQVRSRSPLLKNLSIGLILILVLALMVARVFRPSRRISTPALVTTGADLNETRFRKDRALLITDAGGKQKGILDVEIADTEDKQRQGLMFRKDMEEQQGMLFVFDDLTERQFWMKNTIISLDIIFINERNEILNINERTTPMSEQTYPSIGPAKYALEVNAGYCQRGGIVPGDKIRML